MVKGGENGMINREALIDEVRKLRSRAVCFDKLVPSFS